MFFCFFFQAEDGIRDVAVTGVQTCALPIYAEDYTDAEIKSIFSKIRSGKELTREENLKFKSAMLVIFAEWDWERGRSEERRVGKECRSRWWQYHEEKKEERHTSK